ncbi:hypothetical protein GCM10009558_101340 [Virgisporangium aurantiacum]
MEQYPAITPPVVNVSASWPGASASDVAEAIAAPLEAQLNGVDHMLYMESTSSDEGTYRLSIPFAAGTDADLAAIDVQNRVAQALALLARVLRAAGTTTIGMEDPGSRGARDQLAHWGLTPEPVPVDDHGLRVTDLVASGLRNVFVTPAHQFPTGVVMTPDRRRALLDWAAGDGLVIEDDYDAEYRYDRAPVPALKASAPDRVAYAGSTSKTLAPGMRLGWLLPPRRLYEQLVVAKHASDLGSPAIPQLVFARMLATGEFARHVRLVRARHKARRDALLTALRQELPFSRVRGAAAGLHLMIQLPDLAGMADTDLVDKVRAAGVLVHPLSWHRQRPGVPGFVIGYAAHPPGRLRDAAKRIAAIVQPLRAS